MRYALPAVPMRYALLAVAASLCFGSVTTAQNASTPRFEVRVFGGALFPNGAQRHDFKAAVTLGVQGGLEMSRYAYLVATGAWTHGHAKFASFSDDVTYVWHYDAGAEFNAFFEGDLFTFRPFLGTGAGGRTYAYQASGEGSRTSPTIYGAFGSELQIGSAALHAELRDYLTFFESPLTDRRSNRNDVLLTLGFAYHVW